MLSSELLGVSGAVVSRVDAQESVGPRRDPALSRASAVCLQAQCDRVCR